MTIETCEQFKLEELAFELDYEAAMSAPASTLKFNSENKLPMQDALALAYAAYRTNGYQYVKETRRYSSDNPTLYSNKELIYYTIQTLMGDEWVPPDFQALVVINEDYAKVEECQKHFARYSMLSLGKLSDFQRTTFEAISATSCIPNGIHAYVPAFVDTERKELALKKIIRMEYRNSEHLFDIKSKVQGVVKIIEARFMTHWGKWVYTAVIEGNLISFATNEQYDVGSMQRINAKVKAHVKNKLFDVPETQLNYVKVTKV